MEISSPGPHFPAHINALPNDYPEWRWRDRVLAFEDTDPGHQGRQVKGFMLLERLHDYIAEARRELEALIATKLCTEHCCCTRSTPFITRLEAEYIVSMNGYYSDLIRIAEEWLVTPHECCPTYPADQPGMAGGKLRQMPSLAQEVRVLAGLPSPYLLGRESREQLVSGPFARTSFAHAQGAYAQAENWDLLESTQPLACAVAGVFRLPPAWCHRKLGLGETVNLRVVADPSTLRQGVGHLEVLYQQEPELAQYGLLPTMLARAGNPWKFDRLVTEGKVALAKLGLSRGRMPFALWEDQYVGTTQRNITSSAAGATGGTRGAH